MHIRARMQGGLCWCVCLGGGGGERERIEQREKQACRIVYMLLLAMQLGDAPHIMGSNLEELMRHVTALRAEGVEVTLTILRTLCVLGGAEDPLKDAVDAAAKEPEPEAEGTIAAEEAVAAEEAAATEEAMAADGAVTAEEAVAEPMETDQAAG
jgi:hypothetical protein